MKRFFFLFFVVLLIQKNFNSYAQDTTSTKINSEQEPLTLELIEKYQKMQLSLLRESERNFELAGKIIDYSALFFSLLVVFLGIAGWIGARRFRQIDHTSNEMKILLEKMQKELEQMQKIKDDNLAAIEDLKRKIENESKSFMEVIYLMRQGEILYEQGQLDEAINIYKKIINIKPNSPETYFMLGVSYSLNSDPSNAIHFLKKAIDLNPNYDEAFYELGKAFRRKGDLDLSIEYLNKSLEINPKQVRAIANIAYSYLKLNKFQEALNWYKKSTVVDPNYPLSYMGIALINSTLGNMTESLRYYDLAQELLELMLNEGTLRFWDTYHLGETYLISDRYTDAENYYRRALSMNAANETLHSILFRLELLKSSPKPPKGINKIIRLLTEKSKTKTPKTSF